MLPKDWGAVMSRSSVSNLSGVWCRLSPSTNQKGLSTRWCFCRL
ncbi:Uncharacterised protein [Vibrio cholerae]|nr:Uncharacterised protein [Vibrio cholerae]